MSLRVLQNTSNTRYFQCFSIYFYMDMLYSVQLRLAAGQELNVLGLSKNYPEKNWIYLTNLAAVFPIAENNAVRGDPIRWIINLCNFTTSKLESEVMSYGCVLPISSAVSLEWSLHRCHWSHCFLSRSSAVSSEWRSSCVSPSFASWLSQWPRRKMSISMRWLSVRPEWPRVSLSGCPCRTWHYINSYQSELHAPSNGNRVLGWLWETKRIPKRGGLYANYLNCYENVYPRVFSLPITSCQKLDGTTSRRWNRMLDWMLETIPLTKWPYVN